MWLFTQQGFLSVVVDGTDRTQVLVRSTTESHLRNLLKLDFMDGHTIEEHPAAEYRFQMKVKRTRWLTLATELAGDVRYTNFETAVSKHMAECGPRYVQTVRALAGK